MDWFGWNFQGLFGLCLVAIGWVVLVPSPHLLGLGLHPVLFPVVYLLHGLWCYRIITYNFEQIFYFGPRPTNACYTDMDHKRSCNFFENWPIFIKLYTKNFLWFATQPGLQLGPVLELTLLSGCWCYCNMTYHFGKYLVCWTNMWERILILGLGLYFWLCQWGLQGGENNLRIGHFFIT